MSAHEVLSEQVATQLQRHGYTTGAAPFGQLLAGGGSGRAFYRVATDQGSVVVMSAPRPRADFRSWLDVHCLLEEQGIPVPRVLAAEPDVQVVIMEDLGDDSLERVVAACSDSAARREVYRQALDVLCALQALPAERVRQCRYMRHRDFGYEALRWESDYFVECCLRQLCGLQRVKATQLEAELHGLATALAEEPRVFMHRDFQSRNIHLLDGQVRIIDFQTATWGVRQYDLAALLRDPYVALPPAERSRLVTEYLACSPQPPASEEQFLQVYKLACLQRSMQALGAFAFLGLQRGQPEFLAHVAPGLALLGDTLAQVDDYRVLRQLVGEAAEAYAQLPD